MFTHAKGEQKGAPKCIAKLDQEDKVNPREFVIKAIGDGYVHFLSTRGPRITVGDISWEWRILDEGIFFKKKIEGASDIASIVEASRENDFPIWAVIKAYSDMSGVGRQSVTARFNLEEMREWAEFFELKPDEWKLATELLG